MTALAALWRAVDRALGFAMRAICLACVAGLFCILLGMVLIRFLPVATLSWSSEVIELLFAWMVFVGAAALWRENDHFRIESILIRMDATPIGPALRILVEAIAFVFVAIFTYYTWNLLNRAGGTSPILDWPRELWYVCMPLSGAIMGIYSLRNAWQLAVTYRAGTPRHNGQPQVNLNKRPGSAPADDTAPAPPGCPPIAALEEPARKRKAS
ncbi:MAG: TRAP transporter small permease [Rhodospirillaceae bacterium]|nr:TRAP transporter small permease [Rhodospirillaceae bacterium]